MAEQEAEQASPAAGAGNERNQRPSPEPPEPERKRGKRHFIIIGVVAVVIVAAILYWWHSTFYESTDDAQVSGHLIQISSRVTGHVARVEVQVNQFVKAGASLIEIDPRDFQVAVEQDEANLASAEANYEAARVAVPVLSISTRSSLTSAASVVSTSGAVVQQAQRQLQAAQAAVARAKANNQKAQSDLRRFTPLVKRDIISRQEYDAAQAAAAAGSAAVLEAKANEIAAEDAVRIARDKVRQSKAALAFARTAPDQVKIERAKADQAAAKVKQAKAALDQAKLNLGYTKIFAPESGIITRKSVEPAQNVNAGQNLMTLVSLDHVWVTANFKETQLKEMRQGQEVNVHVDAYGRDYAGVVTQIGGATGSMLSLFPPENATGNFVKVVQRVPVRIDLTRPNQNRDHLLRPGLSVEATVRVKK